MYISERAWLLCPHTCSRAQVIKIEEPLRGDDTRSWGPPFASNTNDPNAAKESAYFLGVNRNKLSVTVNIKDSQGQEILQNLASQCDVLIENYLPGKLSSYGLGYEQLNSENRGLIYASVSTLVFPT